MPSRPAAAVRWISAVGRAADRLQDDERVAKRGRRHQLARLGPAALGHRRRLPAARLGRAQPVGVRRRDDRRVRQRQAHGLDDAGHRARRAHHHAGAGRRREAAVDGVDLLGASMRPPRKSLHRRRQSVHAPSVSPRWWPTSIGPTGTKIAGTSADAAAIICAGNGLVAAADQHHGVHRLRADHLLGVHRHQVAQEHAGRVRERLVDRDRRELHRQPARQHHAALDRVDELRHVAVAGVVVAEGVGDADDRPRQRVVREAHRLDEGLAQEEREVGVAYDVRPSSFPWSRSCGIIIRWRVRRISRHHRARKGAAGQQAPLRLRRSALRADSAAVLGLRSRRITRYVRCAYCSIQSIRAEQNAGHLDACCLRRMRSASGCPGCAPS